MCDGCQWWPGPGAGSGVIVMSDPSSASVQTGGLGCVIIVPSFIATVTSCCLLGPRLSSECLCNRLCPGSPFNGRVQLAAHPSLNKMMLLCLSTIPEMSNLTHNMNIGPLVFSQSLVTPSPDCWLRCWWSCYRLSAAPARPLVWEFQLRAGAGSLSLPAHRHRQTDKLVRSQISQSPADRCEFWELVIEENPWRGRVLAVGQGWSWQYWYII